MDWLIEAEGTVMSTWKSAGDVEKHLETLPDLERLELLNSVCLYYRLALYASEYQADPAIEKIVRLTPAGKSLALETWRRGPRARSGQVVQSKFFEQGAGVADKVSRLRRLPRPEASGGRCSTKGGGA